MLFTKINQHRSHRLVQVIHIIDSGSHCLHKSWSVSFEATVLQQCILVIIAKWKNLLQFWIDKKYMKKYFHTGSFDVSWQIVVPSFSNDSFFSFCNITDVFSWGSTPKIFIFTKVYWCRASHFVKMLLRHFVSLSIVEAEVNTIDLTLKAPITTAADDKFCDIFPNFRQKQGMPADDSREISCLIGYFCKSGKIWNLKLSSAAHYRWSFKGQRAKPTKWVSARQRLRSVWASVQFDQSLCCVLSG